jgi:DNA helicase-2/ATP-dependent DNA helicase PcrA
MLENLNTQQVDAVVDNKNPLLVLAGAGSGKTTLLTVKYAYLVKNEGLSPHKIFAVTFTNKAAKEMKERIEKLTGITYNIPWISTFHSFGVKVLRKFIDRLGYSSDFTIYDDADQKNFLKKLIKNDLNLDEKTFPPKKVAYFINSFKNSGVSPEELELNDRNPVHNNLKIIYSLYQDKMRENNSVDFGDLLYLTVRLFNEFEDVAEYYRFLFNYILVDEYQDTNKIQYNLIKLLAKGKRGICVVGDDDQSIYGWRGANIENILRFEKDFPGAKIIKLEQNYRSTSNILNAANELISRNKRRKGKNLWTDRGTGEKITVFKGIDEYDEARFVVNEISKINDYPNSAILYRTNAQSRVFEDELVKKGIPYVIIGGFKFFDRKEVKDIIAYLKIIDGSDDILSYERVINVPARGIGAKTFGRIIEISAESGKNIYNVLEEISNGDIDFPARAKKGVEKFFNTIKLLRKAKDSDEMTISDLAALLIEKTEYLNVFDSLDPIESENKILNIQELIGSIKHFEDVNKDGTLTDYLDNVTLTSSGDVTSEGNCVSLMTIHSAKGLEFEYVFLTGFEDSLLPHVNSKNSEAEIEEERRLCYVAITRAKQKLYITLCDKRSRGRMTQYNMPSPFLKDLPLNLLELYEMNVIKPKINSSTIIRDNKSANANAPCSGIKAGMNVNHGRFGTGKVLALTGYGEERKVVIFFRRYGKKTLLLKKANLQFL